MHSPHGFQSQHTCAHDTQQRIVGYVTGEQEEMSGVSAPFSTTSLFLPLTLLPLPSLSSSGHDLWCRTPLEGAGGCGPLLDNCPVSSLQHDGEPTEPDTER